MLFLFGPRSALLLLFVVPGLLAAGWLLGRALRRGTAPDALLALLLLLPALSVARWMLGYAGWFDSHDGYSTFMFYVPWNTGLALGPAYYLYFRSLTNQEFRWRQARLLLPALAQALARPLAALYDLGYYRGLRGQALPHHFGTQGPASKALDYLSTPLEWLALALLLAYALRTLADYRRYRRYLDDNFSDAERLRFAGLRQLLVVQLAVLALGLTYSGLDFWLRFSYDAAWYFYAGQGLFIYGLVVVGIQANYAAATSPLRFEAPAVEQVSASQATPGASEATPGGSAATPAASQATPGESQTTPEASQATPAASQAAPGKALATVAGAAPAPAAALAPELLPWRDKLLALMADEQPWLEPELTLTELAQRLRTNPSLLSRVINQGCGQNFNDFVNTYRVREARRKLADARYAHYSLVGVALESGFNSKSTFNRVFKKLTGQAPGELARG